MPFTRLVLNISYKRLTLSPLKPHAKNQAQDLMSVYLLVSTIVCTDTRIFFNFWPLDVISIYFSM